MSYKSKRAIFPVFYFLDTLVDQVFKGIHGYCVVFVSAFLCSPVCLLLRCSCSHGDGSRFVYAVNVLSNPRSILTEDHMGSSNLGHSFNLVLLFYGMVTWEAAHIYLIAKMLIATHFLKWKKEKKMIYMSGCLVLCFKQGCCGSVSWIMDKKMISRFSKILVLYRCSKKKKKKQIKCSVLVCVNFFWRETVNRKWMDGWFLCFLSCNPLYILINPKLAEPTKFLLQVVQNASVMVSP